MREDYLHLFIVSVVGVVAIVGVLGLIMTETRAKTAVLPVSTVTLADSTGQVMNVAGEGGGGGGGSPTVTTTSSSTTAAPSARQMINPKKCRYATQDTPNDKNQRTGLLMCNAGEVIGPSIGYCNPYNNKPTIPVIATYAAGQGGSINDWPRGVGYDCRDATNSSVVPFAAYRVTGWCCTIDK